MTTEGDTSANNLDGTYEEEEFVKHEKRSKLQQCGDFVYDKKSGTILGRTGKSWFQIIVFYIVFYAFLAGFFGLCLYVFLETLNETTPRFYGKGSILGHNPGMGYQPWLPHDPESTLIYINQTDPKSYKKYVDQLNSFLKRYENSEHTRDCTREDENNAEEGKEACKFAYHKYLEGSGCTPENEFGFKVGKPCIFLTLNRVIDWRPMAYPRGSVPDAVKDRYDFDGSVAIDCSGEYYGDKEYIGKRNYLPKKGISGRYFPYRKMKNYQQPFLRCNLRTFLRASWWKLNATLSRTTSFKIKATVWAWSTLSCLLTIKQSLSSVSKKGPNINALELT